MRQSRDESRNGREPVDLRQLLRTERDRARCRFWRI
jgi:hypothetical protein